MERPERRLERTARSGGQSRRGRGRGNKRRVCKVSSCESEDPPERLKCSYCGRGEDSTPMFRSGPAGPRSLCNACGLEWATKGTLGGGKTVSQEEGTDRATVYEGQIYSSQKDLPTQLHLSEVKGLKWQKIAAERLEKNQELQTEIQCLHLKIKDMTEAKAISQTQLELMAEIQSLKERNESLVKTLDKWAKHHSSTFSSHMENLMQIMHKGKRIKQSTQEQPSQGPGIAGRYDKETKAEENICIGDPNNGHRESCKQTGNFELNGCKSAAELNVDVEQQQSGYPPRQTQDTGRRGSKVVQEKLVDGSRNECLLTSPESDDVEIDSKVDMSIDIGGQSCKEDAATPSGLQTSPRIPSDDRSEGLFTAAERKAALALVNEEFLMWLNNRTRRPTPKEMSLHKTQVLRNCRGPLKEASYWTGIPGRVLLHRFHADTEMEEPSCHALTTLLRSVLHIESSKRVDTILWCLVWADCMNPAQLPGYLDSADDVKLLENLPR